MFFRRLIAPAAAALTLLSATLAPAEVRQTSDNTPLPQPVGTQEIQLSKDLGWKRELQVWKDTTGMQLQTPVLYGSLFPTFVDGDAVIGSANEAGIAIVARARD